MNPRIIVALDYPDIEKATTTAQKLDPSVCRVKVGKELFTASGPVVIEKLMKLGFDVFLDLKFHDIPNTASRACRSAASSGVWMLNVHASGGRKMLDLCREAIDKCVHSPLLIGVTVLTSIGDAEILELGVNSGVREQVMRLANLSNECGLDGIVCSPSDMIVLRREFPTNFSFVTPGVRPLGSPKHDQVRVMSPSEALRAGADYLVIGRPITESKDPGMALTEINNSLFN